MVIYTVHKQGSWDTVARIYKEQNGSFSFCSYFNKFPYPSNIVTDDLDSLFRLLDKLLKDEGIYECISTDKSDKGCKNKNVGSSNG